jgi:hypothetical protein
MKWNNEEIQNGHDPRRQFRLEDIEMTAQLFQDLVV